MALSTGLNIDTRLKWTQAALAFQLHCIPWCWDILFHSLLCAFKFMEHRWHQDKIFRGRHHKLKTTFPGRVFLRARRRRLTWWLLSADHQGPWTLQTHPSHPNYKVSVSEQEARTWRRALLGLVSNFETRMRIQAFLGLALPATFRIICRNFSLF